MLSFGNKEGMPAARQETKLEKLIETSPEVLAKLRERAQAAADRMKDVEGEIDEKLVNQAAYFVALAAEHRGEPYTLEQIENNEQVEELMERALIARGEVASVDSTIILDQGDMQVGNTVSSGAEARETMKETQEGM